MRENLIELIDLRKALKKSIQKNNSNVFYSTLREKANNLAGDIDRITLLLHDYLLGGGYPEVVKTDDLYLAAESLKTYLNLTIYKDIVRTFKIRGGVTLSQVYRTIDYLSSAKRREI